MNVLMRIISFCRPFKFNQRKVCTILGVLIVAASTSAFVQASSKQIHTITRQHVPVCSKRF
jgi:hypothetical protein